MIWPWLLRNEQWGLQHFRRQWGLPVATYRGWLSNPQSDGLVTNPQSICPPRSRWANKRGKVSQKGRPSLSFHWWKNEPNLFTGPSLPGSWQVTRVYVAPFQTWSIWAGTPWTPVLTLSAGEALTPCPYQVAIALLQTPHCQSPCPVLICKSGHFIQNTLSSCFPCQVWIKS